MNALDATGLFALEEVAWTAAGEQAYPNSLAAGAREQPAAVDSSKAEFAEVIGKENICDNVQAALRRAEEVFGGLVYTTILPNAPLV